MRKPSSSCAACKYQRRKCPPHCLLRPYFPRSKHTEFRAVRQYVGLNNLVHMLSKVDPNERADQVHSLVFEAEARETNPTHGTLGIINGLQQQVTKLEEELAQIEGGLHSNGKHGFVATENAPVTTNAWTTASSDNTNQLHQGPSTMFNASCPPPRADPNCFGPCLRADRSVATVNACSLSPRPSGGFFESSEHHQQNPYLFYGNNFHQQPTYDYWGAGTVPWADRTINTKVGAPSPIVEQEVVQEYSTPGGLMHSQTPQLFQLTEPENPPGVEWTEPGAQMGQSEHIGVLGCIEDPYCF